MIKIIQVLITIANNYLHFMTSSTKFLLYTMSLDK